MRTTDLVRLLELAAVAAGSEHGLEAEEGSGDAESHGVDVGICESPRSGARTSGVRSARASESRILKEKTAEAQKACQRPPAAESRVVACVIYKKVCTDAIVHGHGFAFSRSRTGIRGRT